MKIFLLSICSILFTNVVFAESYSLPLTDKESIIGEINYVESSKEETLVDIARRYDLGYDEIIKANLGVNRWLPGEKTKILLPSKFILPDAPHQGIVLNLAELRLYYFSPKKENGNQLVYTFPISIGRMDWKSPLGSTKVVKKEKDPAWNPPASIKAEHARDGDYLPDKIPGGDPTNPLGHYALRLGIPGYLIHGVNEQKEYGIGMRVTHGCVRLYPEDIELLFSLVPEGTAVTFVDQPLKVGLQGEELLIEAHAPLEEDELEFEYSHKIDIEEAQKMITQKINSEVTYEPAELKKILQEASGIPVVIAHPTNSLPPAL